MKKTLLLTVLFGTQAVFAADCPPAESIDFSGIHLGGDVSNVLDVFPNAELEKETSYSMRLNWIILPHLWNHRLRRFVILPPSASLGQKAAGKQNHFMTKKH